MGRNGIVIVINDAGLGSNRLEVIVTGDNA